MRQLFTCSVFEVGELTTNFSHSDNVAPLVCLSFLLGLFPDIAEESASLFPFVSPVGLKFGGQPSKQLVGSSTETQ